MANSQFSRHAAELNCQQSHRTLSLFLHSTEISTMGKGGDAAAKSKGMQLSEKVQKYTWAEVKKHVSCLFAGYPRSH